jgi:hypothetical protein
MTEVLNPAVPGYDGWLSEFEAFQQAAQVAPSSSVPRAIAATAGSVSVMSKSTRQPKPERSAAEELEAEMKLLHWHKLANEAALKAALLKTKKAKSSKGAGGILRAAPPAAANHMPLEEKAVWVQQIIEEEQSKPLQVGRDFIEEYERHEKTQGARLDREIERHIASLKRLREQVTVREAMRSRRAEFRTVQQQLEREKHELLQGRLTGASPVATAADAQQKQDAGAAAAVSVSGALNTVLGSLSKLMELEKRISNLESNNAYDEQYPAAGNSNNQNSSQAASVTGSSSTAAAAARLSFTKRRAEASLTQPSKEYYAVQQHRQRQQQQQQRYSSTRSSYNSGLRSAATTGRRLQRPAQSRRVAGAANVRSGSRTVGARSVYQQQQQRRSSGTFMTSVPEARRTHSSAIVEKRRVEARRKAAREQAESVRITRQDKIISEWVQQRRARASTNSSSSGAAAAAAMPAAGRAKRARTGNNPHLEQFQDIRAEYTKRKEALLRGMTNGSAPARGTRTSSNTTTAAARASATNRYDSSTAVGGSSATRGGGLGAARTLRASGTLNSSAPLSKTANTSSNRHNSSSSSSAVVTAQRGGLQSGPLSIGGAGFTVSNSQFVRGKAPQALPAAVHNRAAARQQPLSKVHHGAGTGVKGARAARARR